MMAQMQQQQGGQPPVQDGTGKDTMDPLAMGKNKAKNRFINDTLEPAR
jgi:hypothetical protein